MAERSRPFVVEASPIRCPFCHDSIETVEERWLACERCLARHHAPCWREAGRCASCASPSALARSSIRPRADPDVRVATAMLFHRQRRRLTRAERAALLAPLTLGIFPIADAEIALHRHALSNARDLPPIPELPPDHRLPLEEARKRIARPSRLRRTRAVLLGAFTSLALTALVFFGWKYLTLEPPPPSTPMLILSDLGFVIAKVILTWGLFAAQVVAALAATTHLHLFRAAVRRHERAQLHVGLIGAASPPEEALAVLERTGRDWGPRVAVDGLLTLASVVPGLGAVALLLAAARLRGTLELHAEHERALPPLKSTATRRSCSARAANDEEERYGL
jgi:hypothetical protein